MRRRRRAGVLALVVVAGALIGTDLLHAGADAEGRIPAAVHDPGTGTGTGSAGVEGEGVEGEGVEGEAPGDAGLPPLLQPSPADPPADAATDPAGGPPVSYPETGPGTFGYLTGAGPTLGWSGELRRFRIAVEDGIGQRADEFAAIVDKTLGDERSWVAGRQFRLQRVPRQDIAEFTIYLATPGTSEQMCALGGLATEKYTSCRLPGQVIINVARWLEAVPHFDGTLAEYRAYAINHEVGHQFGMGHELCPAPGRPAPVMQQQTYGLQGCTANGWPFLDGKRYTGPPML
ncbi:DUF3152 domain-containing protein [Micromonospora sp. NBC_01813]|uniref:DUF3152 domain-containing protein n=1 Tax=Micromonospora sp. NBC_01813 TaxID=2975988 RepID=UPI002DDC24D8|nr:DUF3152 domain-containing protein [Micromonospora sp. NBC_01813]WSA08124.1 DUF3152 domain-containing protein [Micromonospora sp. NBC_01813]